VCSNCACFLFCVAYVVGFPDARVSLFGSSVTGLCSGAGDVDLCLHLDSSTPGCQRRKPVARNAHPIHYTEDEGETGDALADVAAAESPNQKADVVAEGSADTPEEQGEVEFSAGLVVEQLNALLTKGG